MQCGGTVRSFVDSCVDGCRLTVDGLSRLRASGHQPSAVIRQRFRPLAINTVKGSPVRRAPVDDLDVLEARALQQRPQRVVIEAEPPIAEAFAGPRLPRGGAGRARARGRRAASRARPLPSARAGSAAWCSACDSSATSTLASSRGTASRSPRFQTMLLTRRRRASARARFNTSVERSTAITRRAHRAASTVRYPSPQPRSATSQRRQQVAERAGPCRPAPARHQLTAVGVAVRREALLAQPQHLLQPRAVGARHRVVGRGGELRVEQRPQRLLSVARLRRRHAEIREAAFAPFLNQPVIPQQPQVPRHARLGDAENAGELGDVQAFGCQHPQDAGGAPRRRAAGTGPTHPSHT